MSSFSSGVLRVSSRPERKEEEKSHEAPSLLSRSLESSIDTRTGRRLDLLGATVGEKTPSLSVLSRESHSRSSSIPDDLGDQKGHREEDVSSQHSVSAMGGEKKKRGGGGGVYSKLLRSLSLSPPLHRGKHGGGGRDKHKDDSEETEGGRNRLSRRVTDSECYEETLEDRDIRALHKDRRQKEVVGLDLHQGDARLKESLSSQEEAGKQRRRPSSGLSMKSLLRSHLEEGGGGGAIGSKGSMGTTSSRQSDVGKAGRREGRGSRSSIASPPLSLGGGCSRTTSRGEESFERCSLSQLGNIFDLEDDLEEKRSLNMLNKETAVSREERTRQQSIGVAADAGGEVEENKTDDEKRKDRKDDDQVKGVEDSSVRSMAAESQKKKKTQTSNGSSSEKSDGGEDDDDDQGSFPTPRAVREARAGTPGFLLPRHQQQQDRPRRRSNLAGSKALSSACSQEIEEARHAVGRGGGGEERKAREGETRETSSISEEKRRSSLSRGGEENKRRDEEDTVVHGDDDDDDEGASLSRLFQSNTDISRKSRGGRQGSSSPISKNANSNSSSSVPLPGEQNEVGKTVSKPVQVSQGVRSRGSSSSQPGLLRELSDAGLTSLFQAKSSGERDCPRQRVVDHSHSSNDEREGRGDVGASQLKDRSQRSLERVGEKEHRDSIERVNSSSSSSSSVPLSIIPYDPSPPLGWGGASQEWRSYFIDRRTISVSCLRDI